MGERKKKKRERRESDGGSGAIRVFSRQDRRTLS